MTPLLRLMMCIALLIEMPIKQISTHGNTPAVTTHWGLDSTFGNGGIVRFSGPKHTFTFSHYWFKVFLRSDEGFAIPANYIDSSQKFGSGGVIFVLDKNGVLQRSGGSFPSLPMDRAVSGLQPDDRLVVVDRDSVKLVRYNLDLTKDGSFYENGLNELTEVVGGFWSPVMQQNGQILVTNYGPNRAAFGRLNANGMVDHSSATTFIWDVERYAGTDRAGRVVIQHRTLCATRVYSVSGVMLGQLFDSNDPLFTSVIGGCGDSSFEAHPNGGFVWTQIDSIYNIRLYRSKGNNGLDNTFGNNGAITVSLGSGRLWTQGIFPVAVQPDGKVLVGVLAGSPMIFRYDVDGSPDIEFGAGLSINVDMSDITQILLYPDGKILIVGLSSRGEIMLMRLKSFVVQANVYLPTLYRP